MKENIDGILKTAEKWSRKETYFWKPFNIIVLILQIYKYIFINLLK